MSDFNTIQNALELKAMLNCRLYKCQAYIYRYDKGYALKSYNTFVAVYSISEKHVVELGRFSMTTYKHISKFYKWLESNGYPVQSSENIELVNWFK